MVHLFSADLKEDCIDSYPFLITGIPEVSDLETNSFAGVW